MKKRKEHAFGKDVYLLGAGKDGLFLWLESPSWDCGWYWGFGYIEQYTRHKSPQASNDIQMHTHWDSIHNGNVLHVLPFKETTFSEKEYTKLKVWFDRFYNLREQADKAHRKDEERWKRINHKVLPVLMNDLIIKTLSPE